MVDQDALDAFQRFQNWTRENRPELAAELGPMSFAQARIRLNKETGLNIAGDAWADDAFDRYLQALKSKKMAGEGGKPLTGPVQVYEDSPFWNAVRDAKS